MTKAQIDHLVVTAPTLELGADYISQRLGVQPVMGGKHSQMGTHNCFVKLGKQLYLEVIAIDPSANAPDRARWFQLDAPNPKLRVRLAGWVACCNDIEAASVAAPTSLGEVTAMSRASYNWRISIPKDGSFPMQGAAPCLIQWGGSHPAEQMQDSACSLASLQLFHNNPQLLSATLAAIGFEDACAVSILDVERQPQVQAVINTPKGKITLN